VVVGKVNEVVLTFRAGVAFDDAKTLLIAGSKEYWLYCPLGVTRVPAAFSVKLGKVPELS